MNSATTELFAETILTQSLPLFEINVDFLEGTDNFTLRVNDKLLNTERYHYLFELYRYQMEKVA